MRVERALLEELSEKVFNIGYQGELNHTQVIISCPVMFRDYPDAVASMVVKPPQGDLYPVSLTRDGNDLTWDVSASDVAIPGAGILQLTFTDGEGEEAEIIKTVYGAYSVNASLVANGEAPDPVQSWLDEAGAALATFENEIGDIRKITTATESDEGLALSPKTVVNGKVTEWEYIDLADPEVVTQAVDDWLDDHPEATTTVEDGAITEAKLNDSLKADLAWQDDVDELKSAINQSKAPAILDTASGEIVTIPDGADGMLVEQMVVGIEPVQDLHGYDNPWPAGSGKNFGKQIPSKTDVGITATLLNNGTVLVNGTATGYFYTESIFTLEAGSYLVSKGSNAGIGDVNVQIRDASTDNLLCTATNTGASITLSEDKQIKFRIAINNTATVANVVVEPMIRLSSVSDSTFAPYSNICPISGWTGANVSRTGVNVWDEEWEIGEISTTNGENTSGNDIIRSKNYIPVLPSTIYYFKTGSTAINTYRHFYDANKNYLGYALANTNSVFTTPANARYMRFRLGTAYGSAYHNDVCINLSDPSKNGQYAPGHVQTKTYTFPDGAGTVYGGTLTVNADGTGKLVVDKAGVDLGSLTWARNTQYVNPVFLGLIDNAKIPATSSQYADAICSMYRQLSRSESNVPGINDVFAMGPYYSGSYNVNIIDKAYSDTTTFKTAMTGQKLVYELATPVVYNLTALEVIELLKGVNNLWADCGNVTMKYPCDTRLFIERLTAPTEDDMIANANIQSGKFFMVGNNLYISTSAIAQGETIIPGTNCTAVSLADALNQINQ